MSCQKILLLLIFIGSQCFGQTSMQLPSGKSLNATSQWQFVCESYSYEGFLTVQIAKTEKGGIIKLSIKTSSEKLMIGDRIFVLLKNGGLVYCTDKGNRTYIDGVSSNFYAVTEAEFKLFTIHSITDIRFKIIGTQKSFDSQIGFFTASNIPTIFDVYSKEVTAIDTKTEIKKLIK